MYSETCVLQWPPLGLKKSGRYTLDIPIKLLSTLKNYVLGWLFLTGGRCSEVVVNTGLTVQLLKHEIVKNYCPLIDLT
jgi:hypothetical protein